MSIIRYALKGGEFKRKSLSLAVSIVAGIMIGSGLFYLGSMFCRERITKLAGIAVLLIGGSSACWKQCAFRKLDRRVRKLGV